MPIGYIGFATTESFEMGAETPTVSIWLKNKVEAKELEARLFYKGQQIGTTANGGGSVDDDSTNERATESSALSADLHYWKRWEFRWFTFRYDNGGRARAQSGRGGYLRENYPNTTYGDENPGEYTVKVYRNGVQVREAKFSVGADGRLVDGGYAKPSFFMAYNVIIPVKVIGTAEKWNALSWKTNAFYGNPLPGFSVP